jgi:hypothetical protein
VVPRVQAVDGISRTLTCPVGAPLELLDHLLVYGPQQYGPIAAILAGAFLYQSAHHLEPVLDLKLFATRSFSVANAATLLYAMGFFAMLLGNILFLTGVWHCSSLKAGLAVTPAPWSCRPSPARRPVGRSRRLPEGAVGRTALFAGGLCCYATRVGLQPDYLARCSPATLTTRLRIELTFPVLSAAAVSSLHHERFALGGAVNQTARQVGGRLRRRTPRRHPRGSTPSGRHTEPFFGTCGGIAAAMAALSGLACGLFASRSRDPVTAVGTGQRRHR